jgi:hypothetical protein
MEKFRLYLRGECLFVDRLISLGGKLSEENKKKSESDWFHRGLSFYIGKVYVEHLGKAS